MICPLCQKELVDISGLDRDAWRCPTQVQIFPGNEESMMHHYSIESPGSENFENAIVPPYRVINLSSGQHSLILKAVGMAWEENDFDKPNIIFKEILSCSKIAIVPNLLEKIKIILTFS